MNNSKKIYLAGKITKNGWRHHLVPELRHATWDDAPLAFGSHKYIGPFFVGCDHGCFHVPTGHGSINKDLKACAEDYNPVTRAQVHHNCLTAIGNCDVLIAYINDAECYGSIAEIQFALDKRKHVVICFAPGLASAKQNEYWFVCHTAQRVHYDVSEDALADLIDDLFWELVI